MTTRANFLSLPVELRLQILEHAVTQAPDAGLILSTLTRHAISLPSTGEPSRGLTLDPNYSSSANLNVLRVCRQLRNEFTEVAFRRTVFVVKNKRLSAQFLQPLQRHQLENLRNVVLFFPVHVMERITPWRWPFDTESLHLDKLTIVLEPAKEGRMRVIKDYRYIAHEVRQLVELLRRLEHVKSLKLVLNAALSNDKFRMWYDQIVGLVLKEDHYQRYDAPGAPHVENTWWDWQFNSAEKSFELIARPAKSVVTEPEYMDMVAPLVAKLMADMETASS